MLDETISRTEPVKLLHWVWKQRRKSQSVFKDFKTVCVVSGPAGCGKTTSVLNHFRQNRTFYFSFAGLDEALAEKLFSECITGKTGITVSCWDDSLKTAAGMFEVVILDDLASLTTYRRFHKAFYAHMFPNKHSRPLAILIEPPSECVKGIADNYFEISMGYFSVQEVMKLYPTLPKADILGLCTVSGGIAAMLKEYDVQLDFEGNFRNMLKPDCGFIKLMPELLRKCFHRPENYHRILCAITHGNVRMGEIGKFTGFALNKCDNYLSRLIGYGFVKTEKVMSKRGAEKTVHRITNSYCLIWHKYIFQEQSAIQLGNQELIDSIVRRVINTEIHDFHLQKAFKLVNERFQYELQMSFCTVKNIEYNPQTVQGDGFEFTFDAIVRYNHKAIFVKVYQDPLENVKKEGLLRLRQAISLANSYLDSYIYIFTKRRFSDYAVAAAAKDDILRLVEVERLKY